MRPPLAVALAARFNARMVRILGVSGSLRKGSYNAGLLRAAVEVAPSGVTIEIGTIRGIPLYDADVEKVGMPEEVTRLKEQIVAADGLLLVTPEYNNSIPGVFKNAIDWLSRPFADADRVFGARPVAVIGASPNRFGTLLSQTAWLAVLRTLGTSPWWGGRLYVAEAAKMFDAAGNLTDGATRERLTRLIADYAQFVEEEKKKRS